MFLSVFALRKLLCWRLANGSWLCESSRWGTAGAVSQLWQGIAIQPRPRDANSLQRRFWIKEDLKWIKLIKEHQVISSHIKSIQVCLILYFFLSNLKVTLWGLDAPTANVVLRGLRSHWRQALSFAVCHKQRDPLAGRKALRSLRFSFKWSEMFLLISLNFFLNNVSFLILSCLSSWFYFFFWGHRQPHCGLQQRWSLGAFNGMARRRGKRNRSRGCSRWLLQSTSGAWKCL